MAFRRCFLLILTLTFFGSTALASKKDAEAAALIAHAKQLSDIRAEGAPPFRLKLNFKVINEDGSVSEGAHTEDWVSRTQWRMETVLGDFRRTLVVVGRKRWLLESTTAEPEQLGSFLGLTNLGRFRPEAWKPEKVEDRELNGLSVRCIEVKPKPWGGKSALCFDKIDGTVTAQVTQFQAGTRIGEAVCIYADYQRFGNRVLARSYECDKDSHPVLKARVVELVAAPPTDPTFFIPPDGAKESVNCLSIVKAPRAIYSPEPRIARNSVGPTVVMIRVVVGTDGKPHDLRTTSASNRDLDGVALEAVRQWRFKPATCEGESVEGVVEVDVDFQVR